MQVVLQRSSRDEQSSARVEQPDDLGQDRVDILDPMRLINDDVLPGQLFERGFLALADLVRSDTHIEPLSQDRLLANGGTLILVTAEDDCAEARDPVRKLARPVVERRFGHDNQVRAGDIAVNLQVAEKRDCLERLAETLFRHSIQYSMSAAGSKPSYHLVGQNPVDTVVVQADHPVETLDLIVSHLSALDVCSCGNWKEGSSNTRKDGKGVKERRT